MTKKKRKFIVDLVKLITGVLAFLLILFSFTDKTKFWILFGIIILIFIGAVLFFFWLKKKRFKDIYNWHSDKALLNKLRQMHPSEFEEYIADLYQKFGYRTEATGGSYDGGIDVIVTKNKSKHYVQCKKYIKSKVGVSEVREFYGVMAGKLVDGKGIFITTNIFTTEAERFAEDKPIELIDGDKLLHLIKSVVKDGKVIKENNKCPKCGGDLIEKSGKYGKFLGCSNYPKCKYTESIK